MTPLEKASQMIVDYQLTFKSLSYEEAVQCSIRTVDKILQELELVCVDEMVQFSNRWKYWEEVKELLEKQSNKHHIVKTTEMIDHIVDTNEMVCYTKQDVIDAIIKIHDIYSLHGQYNDTLEAKKLRLKGVSWHIQNILESLKKKIPTSSQTEISDDEIEEAAEKGGFYDRVLSASPPPNTFTFSLKNNEPIIVLSEEGFKYKEEFIEDAGEVYKLFKEFLIKANRPTEISDEEIEKYVDKELSSDITRLFFIQGATWYREQLKKKQ